MKFIKSIQLVFFVLLFSHNIIAQTVPSDLPQLLADKAICLDPGHGGHTGDDRRVEVGYGVVYWESEGNFGTANHLYTYLEALGCDVSITRSTNEDESDISLTERIALAELVEADYLHSIHTNGASLGSSVNYTLMLYASLDADNRSVAQFPVSKELSDIMALELPEAVYTTSSSVYADLVFQPTWPNGYGILNGTSVPATISEAAFHSNYDEGRRLHGDLYQQAMAMQMLKSFLKLYDKGELNYGEIGGVLTGNNGVQASNVDVELYRDNILVTAVKTDEFVNGYYYFPWLIPGDYELRFSYEGNHVKTIPATVQKGVHNKLDVDIDIKAEVPGLSKPNKVEFTSVSSAADGKIRFEWKKPTPDPGGYKIYYSEDDDFSSWKVVKDETLLNKTFISYEAESSEFADVPAVNPKHFKIVAVNKMESERVEGDDSKVYSYSLNGGHINVLLVDAFDRLSDVNSGGNHALAAKYNNILSGYSDVKTVVSAHSSAIASGKVIMDDFDVVFWISGEESTADESFSSTEQQKVKTYLENGGKLIVSGAEIGWDLVAKGTADDAQFYTDYLKAVFVSDGGKDFGPVTGAEGSMFSNMSFGFSGVNSWVVEWPDSFTPADGAETLFTYNNGDDGMAAIGYKGSFGASVEKGGVVYFGFPIMSATFENSAKLIEYSINYLLGITLPVNKYETISFKAYPNPVKERVSIFGLEAGEDYKVEIYSVEGKLIFRRSYRADSSEIKIDLSELTNGVYIINIASEAKSGSLRLIKS